MLASRRWTCFWTMLWIFGFIIWIWSLIFVFGDISRSHDFGGVAKALWTIFVLLIPPFGVLVSRARSTTTADRPPGPATTADELAKLASL
jgi:hypothetical protein